MPRACSTEATSAIKGSDRETFLNIHTCLKLGRRVLRNAPGFVKRLELMVGMGCHVLQYSANSVGMLRVGQSVPQRQLSDVLLKSLLARWKLSCISLYTID
jgi:hypothetical protein